MSTKKVALVGHCGPDAYLLESTVHKALPDAEIVKINAEKVLRDELAEFSLLLVNRMLDGTFSDEDGIALIGALSKEESAPPAILISNFAAAQAEAENAGARPGFGKNDLYDEETLERIRSAVREVATP
jgi:hypothetical protein